MPFFSSLRSAKMFGAAALGLLPAWGASQANALPAPVSAVPSTPAPAWDTYSDTWVAVDGLGRALPTFAQVGPPRPNKQVGIFYYLWLGANHDNGPYDVTRILAQDPNALKHPNSPLWGRRAGLSLLGGAAVRLLWHRRPGDYPQARADAQ